MIRYRILGMTLLLVVLMTAVAYAQEGSHEEFLPLPEALRVTQESVQTSLGKESYVLVTYPTTVHAGINEEMRMLVDTFVQQNVEKIPPAQTDDSSYLDVGAQFFRSGESCVSFLLLARAVGNRDQDAVEATTRVYDTITGKRLLLTDFFSPDSDAWNDLAEEVRSQLTAYFPDEVPDTDALDRLTDRKALEQADFTVSARRLTLHYRADALYAEKNTLMHVHVYYSRIREMMTELGMRQTDNSRYRMLALTFDDGPGRGSSTYVSRALRNAGASATFFLVGKNMLTMGRDIVRWEHDANHSVASHNYEHRSGQLSYEKVHSWKEAFDQALVELTGKKPAFMRAPGGLEKWFITHDAHLPLIHWSGISGDANEGESKHNVPYITARVMANAWDGAIILLHDNNKKAGQYTQKICEGLLERNYLMVTIEELFDRDGVVLEPNVVYYQCVDGVTTLY